VPPGIFYVHPIPPIDNPPQGGPEDGPTGNPPPGGASLAGGVRFTTPSGGSGLLADSSPGDAHWLAVGAQEEEDLLIRDESELHGFPVERTPTITESLARATHEAKRGEDARLDGGANDLAFLLDRVDHKAIRMAESVLDGDDFVGQFAQFAPAMQTPPVPAKADLIPVAAVPSQQAPPHPATGAPPAAQTALPWPLLLVPGGALLAALWVVLRRRPPRLTP
jgi:hypothetical protein